MLRPISFEALETALPILSRGFPGMRREGWAAAIERLRRFGTSEPTGCAGHLLEAKGRDVGVILTIPSMRRSNAETPYPVVNLSSWYIDPEHRWRAPHMLKTITACNDTLYTDLTATPPVRDIMGRLGFRGWTEGTLIVPLPLLALRPVRSSLVVPLHDLPPDALDETTRRLLEAHAALDCVAGGLWDGETLLPLVFSRKVYRGIHAARLIFAGNRAGVLEHLPAISRFLLKQKFLLLAINADRRERIAGSVFTHRSAPTFYKGPLAPAPADFAYSEFVFLQI